MGIVLIVSILFIGFLIGLKKPIDIEIYFQAMFVGYRASKLRWFWKTLIFGIEYLFGMLVLMLINATFYPADAIRKAIKWLFVRNEDETKTPGNN